jgi:hypothetical protein
LATQYMCSEIVQLELLENDGEMPASTAILEEISLSGACIQMESPMPEGAALRLVCSTGPGGCELEGKVVECRHRDQLGYFVHIGFKPESQWWADHYAPEHLFDPTSLVPRIC